jgi:hypothetical protein
MKSVIAQPHTAQSLYAGALDFFYASRALQTASPLPIHAFSFVAAHSLELALKSYLVYRGADPENLDLDPRHDLIKAWRDAVAQGLHIDSKVPAWCESLALKHSGLLLSRYPRTNTGITSPPLGATIDGLSIVMQRIADAIGHPPPVAAV